MAAAFLKTGLPHCSRSLIPSTACPTCIHLFNIASKPRHDNFIRTQTHILNRGIALCCPGNSPAPGRFTDERQTSEHFEINRPRYDQDPFADPRNPFTDAAALKNPFEEEFGFYQAGKGNDEQVTKSWWKILKGGFEDFWSQAFTKNSKRMKGTATPKIPARMSTDRAKLKMREYELMDLRDEDCYEESHGHVTMCGVHGKESGKCRLNLGDVQDEEA
jgi:hypothetical protein